MILTSVMHTYFMLGDYEQALENFRERLWIWNGPGSGHARAR